MAADDDRTVTTTVGKLRAYEAALQRRLTAQIETERAADAIDRAKEVHQRKAAAYSQAIDEAAAATRALQEVTE
jgi:hypothetical protein